mmetsp:Transcript_32794/g.50059  ORF Transcript_32794/g.50059 Transcript_32794/m.50059 type:complete len:221 (+) Transcript_32794:1886-2548(+)|eukprot:CAMPEP_0170497556 /NCGR_PEP_ID=MMETSP0208-20121228/25027_1 /TAXON_ID=197538 /ORGANISM="Strombidium inclinatum, Strain S3" /LENGTH=220 /DNA_ID=CAMNT_0010774407 /DNA_START=1818 /DNA_END=2480 /DNA_ORIENTATION=+
MTSLKIENEQLRKDNKYLVELLRQTKEFVEIAEYIDDSGGYCTRLDGFAEPTKLSKGSKKIVSPRSEEKAMDTLMPLQAMSLTQKFQEKHGNDLSSELLEQFLRNLNSIWRSREKKTIQRLKQKHHDEIQGMKRLLVQRQPMDVLQFKKTISRLKEDLHQAHKDLRDAQSFKEKAENEPVVLGNRLLDNTLAQIKQIQTQKKEVLKDNKALMRKVSELQA